MTETKGMAIHQCTMKFSAEEDRILFRLSTVSQEEFRFVLTRRFVKQVWPALVQALESGIRRETPHQAHVARELTAFEHEKTVSQLDFKGAYTENATRFPLGEHYILLQGIQLTQAGDRIGVRLLPAAGATGVEFQLTRDFLHVLCELMRQAAAVADWNLGPLNLKLQMPAVAPGKARVLH